MPAFLKKGSSGDEVSKWQDLLTKAGFATPVTGTFDDATEAQTKAWQAAKGLVADGIVGSASWGAMTGQAYTASADPNAQFGRDALLAAWPLVTGQKPNLAELQIAGAQAHLESNYGKSTYKLLDHATGQTLASSGVINNWGAVQGGDPAQGTGFLATDTSPLKVTADNPKGYYDHSYRKYATPAEGAADMVKEMTVRRPTSWALMRDGKVNEWAQQMWAGKLPDGTLNKDPQTGVFGYFEQKPADRAKGILQRAANIAYTLNEPLAIGPDGPPAGAGDAGGGVGDLIPSSPAAKKTLGAVVLAGLAAAAWWFFFRRGL